VVLNKLKVRHEKSPQLVWSYSRQSTSGQLSSLHAGDEDINFHEYLGTFELPFEFMQSFESDT